MSARSNSANGLFFLGVVFVSAILALFPFLGLSAVFQVSEAREGVVVAEILRSGNWILPLRQGEIVPSKPIFFHWIGALFSSLFGYYDGFLLRLPSALAALATIIVFFLFVWRTAGSLAALFSSLILMSSYCFFRLAGDGRVDMVCNFFMIAAVCAWLYSAVFALSKGRTLAAISGWAYAVVALLCGFAILTKGPIGIVLPVLAISAIALFYERIVGLKSLIRAQWLLALAVGAPWYILAALQGKEGFVSRQIIFENISRFFGGKGVTQKPFWFYLHHYWDQAAPWSILFAVYLVVLAYYSLQSRTNSSVSVNHFLPESGRLRFLLGSGIIWFFTLFIFLSLSSGKRRGYLVPLLPGMALVLGVMAQHYFERIRSGNLDISCVFNPQVRKVGFVIWRILAFAFALFLIFALLLGFLPFDWILNEKTAGLLQSIPIVFWRSPLLLVLFSSALLASAHWFWVRGHSERNFCFVLAGFYCFLQLILIVILNLYLSLKGELHTYRDIAAQIKKTVPEGSQLYAVKRIRDESFDGFFFYYPDRVLIQPPKEALQKSGYYIARKRWLDSEEGKRNLAKITEHMSVKRRVDSPRQALVLFSYSAAP